MDKSKIQPDYLDLLSDEDVKVYNCLRKNLSSAECRNNRFRRLEHFVDMLETITNFTNKGNDDDWKRQLVCGVVKLSDGIAVNNHQLSILLGKCKSSINGTLQRMKYAPFPLNLRCTSELVERIPRLKNNYSELRQWTMRRRMAQTPEPKIAVPHHNEGVNLSVSIDNEPVKEFFSDPLCIPIHGWESPVGNNIEDDLFEFFEE